MQKIWERKYSLNRTLGYNPFLIEKMDITINKIAKAINKREKIVIYGSCNVDSICSISLLILLLKYLNADVEYYISEDKEILCSKVIKNHVDMLGASLIISLGCIIESRDQENLINNLGMEVIALLNREYNKDLESIILGNETLSISTLTFKLAQAIASYYNMKSINKYIDLVTIGTYSSSDKISGENKILFEEGIKYLLDSNNYGLRALMTYNGITTPSEEDISKMVLVMTPRVNAVGTIDNARIVVELLTTTSEYRAQQIVKYLEKELKND